MSKWVLSFLQSEIKYGWFNPTYTVTLRSIVQSSVYHHIVSKTMYN